jgi:DNA-binding MarR family transcriptional regulator
MSIEPFFYQSKHRAAFLANMANRLRDSISDDATIMLQESNVKTPVTDISLILYLSKNDKCPITSIAQGLNYSHQRVTSRISTLEKLDLVLRLDDQRDQRKKIICLTASGKSDILKINKIYKNAAKAIEGVFDEIDNDLMDSLLLAINAFEKRTLRQRISDL